MHPSKTAVLRTLASAPAVLLAAALLALLALPTREQPSRPRFARLVAEAKLRVPELTPAELSALLAGPGAPLVVDVREPDEWARGHLPGAVHLSKGVLEREIEAVAPALDADIVLYCGSDARAALAGDNLRRMGYTRVRNLRGGLRAWTEAGGPTTQE
ncbi:MAG: rhodanese-like domain-containing protein [Elusimicrobiota bacterium]|nr:rhodanese-like domain-containing protein [Elusimicrobiota bacterium]